MLASLMSDGENLVMSGHNSAPLGRTDKRTASRNCGYVQSPMPAVRDMVMFGPSLPWASAPWQTPHCCVYTAAPWVTATDDGLLHTAPPLVGAPPLAGAPALAGAPPPPECAAPAPLEEPGGSAFGSSGERSTVPPQPTSSRMPKSTAALSSWFIFAVIFISGCSIVKRAVEG